MRRSAFLFRPILFVLPLLAFVCGCSDTSALNVSAPPTTGLATGGAKSVSVMQLTSGQNATLLQFPAGASGSVSPTATLTFPTGFQPFCITKDSSGQLYVGGETIPTASTEVLVFAAGATGAATPVRNITLSTSLQPFPMAIAVDTSGNIYVAASNHAAGQNPVLVYGPTASGLATPLRTITGPATMLLSYTPFGVTTDSAGNLYLTVDNGINGLLLVFAAGANGNVAPARVIPSTSGFQYYTVALDASGNIYATQVSTTATLSGSNIEKFSGGLSGSATPELMMPLSNDPYNIPGLQLDSVGNLYVIEESITNPPGGGNTVPSYVISAIAPSAIANGIVTPTTVMNSLSMTATQGQIVLE